MVCTDENGDSIKIHTRVPILTMLTVELFLSMYFHRYYNKMCINFDPTLLIILLILVYSVKAYFICLDDKRHTPTCILAFRHINYLRKQFKKFKKKVLTNKTFLTIFKSFLTFLVSGCDFKLT